MPEWDAEVEVDEARARGLIRDEFPELADAPLRPLDAGWDNVVHLVDERWAFRFPRRAIAVPGVEREIGVLPRLATHLPLPIPAPRWVGRPADGYPFPWFGAAYLPGEELARSGLADGERVTVAAALGGFLRALHAPAVVARAGGDLPVDPNRRADMPFRVGHVRLRLDRLRANGLVADHPEVDALLAEAAGLPPPSRVVLLHGDLHARHVLVDHHGSPTGIIDWGDVCVGDPSVDLSIAYGAFRGAARAAFLDAYGAVDGLAELRARVVALWVAAALVEWAADRGLPDVGRESTAALERAVG